MSEFGYMRKNIPLISISIPTYNSEATIDLCLGSIFHQYDAEINSNIEVIVVDNCSSDRTEEICKGYNCRFLRTRCSKAEAREIGFLNSTGKYVLILDSDMCIERGLLKELIGYAEDYNFDAIIINEEFLGKSFFHTARTIENKCYVNASEIQSPRFYKRQVLEKVDWKRIDEGWDEMEIFLEAQKSSSALQIHTSNKKIWLIGNPLDIKKKLHHGRYFKMYKKKYDSQAVRRQFSFSYRAKLLTKSLKISLPYGSAVLVLKFLDFLFFYIGRFHPISENKRKTANLD
jgi:glycosyltransferase involved in cell wall biosynthesis